jgi:hypothetical protein
LPRRFAPRQAPLSQALRICAMAPMLLGAIGYRDLPSSAQQLCVAQELGESQILDAMAGR